VRRPCKDDGRSKRCEYLPIWGRVGVGGRSRDIRSIGHRSANAWGMQVERVEPRSAYDPFRTSVVQRSSVILVELLLSVS
jgi:hypothetical protein